MSYSDFSVENAVRIVEACLAANRPQMIVPALLDRRSPESVCAELAAARTTSALAAASVTTGDLERAAQARFRAQNRAG